MLKGSLFPENYADWLERIEPSEVRSAFVHLVGFAACSRTLTCHPQLKGESGPIRDFRFHDENGEQPFSVIINKQSSLFFYFRPPATRSHKYSLEEVQRLFPGAKNPQVEQWTVPLTTVSDVERLWEYLRAQ